MAEVGNQTPKGGQTQTQRPQERGNERGNERGGQKPAHERPMDDPGRGQGDPLDEKLPSGNA